MESRPINVTFVGSGALERYEVTASSYYATRLRSTNLHQFNATDEIGCLVWCVLDAKLKGYGRHRSELVWLR